jgi:hypothetical protein
MQGFTPQVRVERTREVGARLLALLAEEQAMQAFIAVSAPPDAETQRFVEALQVQAPCDVLLHFTPTSAGAKP